MIEPAHSEVTMAPQNSDDSDTRYQSLPAYPEAPTDQGRKPDDDSEDLGLGASNKAVGITLSIGVGLMLLVLILPYLGGL